MKAGWEIKPLGEVCSLMTGGTPKRSEPSYFENGNIKWLVSGDIHQREILDCEGRITEAGLENSSARELPLNSVMIALNGQGKTRGAVALLRTKATCNQSLVSIMPNDTGQILPEFLYANLHGRYEELRKMTGDSGNDRRGLNMPLIRSIQIPIAPLEEQKRIVAVLDAAFEGLTRAKENAEANLQNARELFEGIARNIFDSGENSWPRLTLAKVCKDFGRGKSRHRPRNEASLYGGDYPFLQTGDLSKAEQLVDQYSQTYSEKGLAQSKLWPTGTVCVAIVGATIGESAITAMPACFPDSIIGMVPEDELARSAYVQYLLEHYMDDLKAAGEGSARDNINLATFEHWSFPMPSIEEQDIVVEKLNEATRCSSDLLSEYTTKLTDIADLRQSLLQKAFAGELT